MTTKKPAQSDYDKRIKERLQQYMKDYKIEDMNESNDRTLLMILIRSELLLDDLQFQLQSVAVEGDLIASASELKKIFDLVRDMTGQVTQVQKTLNIDRKSRTASAEESPAEYIRQLKRNAKNFLDQRAIKVYCPDCKVMAGRIYPVHGHTAFTFEVQCSQCKRRVIAKRDEKDVWFDIKDADWRRKFPAEIVQPELAKGGFRPEAVSDENIIDTYNLYGSDNAEIELDLPVDGLEGGLPDGISPEIVG